jgi:hypothetical protein
MRSFLVAAVVASASISGAAQAADISSGSGVVVGDHGEVVTNAHVFQLAARRSIGAAPAVAAAVSHALNGNDAIRRDVATGVHPPLLDVRQLENFSGQRACSVRP